MNPEDPADGHTHPAALGARPAPSRRALLQVGVLAVGGSVVSAPWVLGAAQALNVASEEAETFMAASQLLIQHQLSRGVGERLAALLASQIPTLKSDLDSIVQVARDRKATSVEDFFAALPSGQVQETAHRIIFGWYAGVIDEAPTAEVFAYEQALMYQPTRDAVALPTYSYDGPDHWTDVDPPLSAMPEF